jgi:hypothetical protein
MRRTVRARKVTPKVKDGAVQKKHRHALTAHAGYTIVRHTAARGYRHIISQRDIRDFIDIIPDWDRLAEGLESIVLTSHGGDEHERHIGRYRVFHREKTGSIEIPAWDGDFWVAHTTAYFEQHRAVLERIGVAHERLDEESVECRYTERQARAFLLLHVFMHELGHHVDRMTTKQRASGKRGEDFAERYAVDLLDRLWPLYVRAFGDPRRGD